jgi:L-iditol 2-dehydrogenase
LDAQVVIIGKVPIRMEKAKRIGAADITVTYSSDDNAIAKVWDFTGPAGANIAIIATNNPDAYQFATRVVGKNAKINFFAGMPDRQTFLLDANWLHYNQISITGTFSSSPSMLRKAVEIASKKIIDLSQIVTHKYSLMQIEEAILATEKYYGLRAVINRFS